MVDKTGTNFGAPIPGGNEGDPNIYAFSFGDFLVGGSTSGTFLNWQVGDTIKLDGNGSPDAIYLDARQSDVPFLRNTGLNDPQAFTVNGAVSDANNGTNFVFNNEPVTTTAYWEIAVAGNPDQTFWVANVEGAGGKSFMLTSANFDQGEEYVLVGRDDSPGVNTGTGFQSYFDQNSGPSDGITYGNTSFFPRLDQAVSPISPRYDSSAFGSPGTYDLAVWSGSQIVIDGPSGTFTINPNAEQGTFKSFDNDDFINDGTAAYTDPVNDIDQIGFASFNDSSLDISEQIYQAEAGFQLTGLVDDGDGNLVEKTFLATLISFGDTNGQNVVFSTETLVPGQQYTIDYVDGTPGIENPNLTDLQETAFRYTELTPAIPCFVRGSMIETVFGEVAVEELKVGDLVMTKDKDFMPIRWIGSTPVPRFVHARDEKRRPVKISAGALGKNLPREDLYVSRQHRMLVNSIAIKQRFGFEEALIKAIDLVPYVDGVEVVNVDRDVDLFHIMLDTHEVIFANGAPTESFYPGEYLLGEMSDEVRTEIKAVLGEVASSPDEFYPLARNLILGQDVRKLLKHNVRKEFELVRS